MIQTDLLNLPLDFSLVSVDLVIAAADLFCLFLLLGNVHLRSVLIYVMLAELFLEFCNGFTDHIPALPALFHGFLHGLQPGFLFPDTGFQFFDLSSSSQKVTAVLKCTTCHRTTRAQRFPLYGNHSQAVPVLSSNGNGMINMIYYQHTSQQKFRNLLILRCSGHQFTGHTDHSRLLQRLPRGKISSRADAAHRQKSSTAVPVFLQKFNQCLRSLIIVRYNILNATSKCRFNGYFIILIYLDQICHNTLDSRNPFFLFHYPADTVTVAVITLCNITQGFQPGSFSVISSLVCFQLSVLLLEFLLDPVSFLTQAITLFIGCTDDLRDGIELLLRFLQHSLLLFFLTL